MTNEERAQLDAFVASQLDALDDSIIKAAHALIEKAKDLNIEDADKVHALASIGDQVLSTRDAIGSLRNTLSKQSNTQAKLLQTTAVLVTTTGTLFISNAIAEKLAVVEGSTLGMSILECLETSCDKLGLTIAHVTARLGDVYTQGVTFRAPVPQFLAGLVRALEEFGVPFMETDELQILEGEYDSPKDVPGMDEKRIELERNKLLDTYHKMLESGKYTNSPELEGVRIKLDELKAMLCAFRKIAARSNISLATEVAINPVSGVAFVSSAVANKPAIISGDDLGATVIDFLTRELGDGVEAKECTARVGAGYAAGWMLTEMDAADTVRLNDLLEAVAVGSKIVDDIVETTSAEYESASEVPGMDAKEIASRRDKLLDQYNKMKASGKYTNSPELEAVRLKLNELQAALRGMAKIAHIIRSALPTYYKVKSGDNAGRHIMQVNGVWIWDGDTSKPLNASELALYFSEEAGNHDPLEVLNSLSRRLTTVARIDPLLEDMYQHNANPSDATPSMAYPHEMNSSKPRIEDSSFMDFLNTLKEDITEYTKDPDTKKLDNKAALDKGAWKAGPESYSQSPEMNPDNTSYTRDAEELEYQKMFFTDPDFNVDPQALEKLKAKLEAARIENQKKYEAEDEERFKKERENLPNVLNEAAQLDTAYLMKEICPSLKGRVLKLIEKYPTVKDLMLIHITTGREIEGCGIDTLHKIMLALNHLGYPMEDAGKIEFLHNKFLEQKGKREIPKEIYFDVEDVRQYNPGKPIHVNHGLHTSQATGGKWVTLDNGVKIIVRTHDIKRIAPH